MARWHSCGNSVILISCVLLYSNVTVWCGAAQPGSMARLFLFTPVSAGTKSPGGWGRRAGRAGARSRLLLRSHVAASVCADLAASHPQPSTAFISSSLGQDQTCHMQPPAQPSPASPVLITRAQAAQPLAVEWPPGPAQQPTCRH